MFKPWLISLVFVLLMPVSPIEANQLEGSDSPYLAMHGEDPVAWQGWSGSVMKRAAEENKLVFVSIGYFSCHWCHVMQRESYQNVDIAKLLNENFISVKVDRELNPDLDAYLIDFVTRTRGFAGWPLNVFLTPEGYPLVGFTYLPPERFLTLLQELQQQWKTAPDYLNQAAARAAEAMKGEQPKSETKIKADDVKQYESIFVSQALELADEMSGGFGEQNKFPMAPHLDNLLNEFQRNPDPAVKKLLITTLDNMAMQGLRDHLGGGFFRYTVDPGWQTPHFEKMLYDNALLALLYLRAEKVLGRSEYQLVARDTLDFVVSEMVGSTGAMVSSFSAIDGNNVEGGYYLWQKATLEKLLNKEELALIEKVWGMKGSPDLEAGYLPRVNEELEDAAKSLKIEPVYADQLFSSARKKLLEVRRKRTLPVDDKYLAALNGLALSALVEGAKLKGGDKYARAAKGVHDYLVNVLWDGQRLWRAKGKSGELGQAGLEDYAFVAQGLFAWSKFNKNDLKSDKDILLVKRLVKDAWNRFYDQSGWRLSDQTLIPGSYGVAMMEESPLPSPSAVLLNVSIDLARQMKDQELTSSVLRGLNSGHTQLRRAAFDYPSQLAVLAKYYSEN